MEFRLLGPFEVRDGDRIIDIGRRQERLLLGILLIENGRHVSTDRLIDLLWDTDPPASSRGTVHTYVARLRSALKPFGVSIAARDGGYSVRGELDVDLHHFRAAAEAASRARDLDEQARILSQARSLWRGPLFTDVADPSLQARLGVEYGELYLSYSEQWGQAKLALGRPDEVITELIGMVAANPTRQRLVACLMTAYGRCGRLEDALALYRSTFTSMIGELGLEPSSELQALHHALLRGEMTEEPQAQSGPRLLPQNPPGFVGRHDDLRRINDLMFGADTVVPGPLVITSLAGMPGVGKTALAIRWGHLVAGRFPDGQLFVDLRGYSQDEPLPALSALRLLLTALGVPDERLPNELDAAAGMWRAILQHRRMLIILDNARSAQQVRPLIPGSDGSAVVITSRDDLGGLIAIDHARRMTVGVLHEADAVRLVLDVIGADRIGDDHRDAAELAQLCGFLPLALRIAAAYLVLTPRTTLRALIEQLNAGDGLSPLTIAGDPLASVRAVFDLSYRSLSTAEQRTFRLVASTPCADLDCFAVAALLDATPAEAQASLDRLVAGHLMTKPTARRYGFHDLMRSYALLLGTAGSASIQDSGPVSRLTDFYLQAAAASNAILSPENAGVIATFRHPSRALPFAPVPAAVIDYLDGAAHTLGGIAELAIEDGDYELAWQMTYLLSSYFDRGRDIDIALAVGRLGVAAAVRTGDPVAERRVRISLGAFCNNARKTDEALTHLCRAVELAKATGMQRSEAAAVNNIGRSHLHLGAYHEAIDAYRAALDLYRASQPSDTGVGAALNNIGEAMAKLGRLEDARKYLDQAVAFARQTGDQEREAHALNNIGDVLRRQSRNSEALTFLSRGLAISRAIGYPHVECESALGIARTLRDLDNPRAAVERLEDALAITMRTGNSDDRASILLELAHNHCALGNQPIAISCLAAADAIRKLVPDIDQQNENRRLRQQLAPRVTVIGS